MQLRDYQIDISDKAAGCLRNYGLAYLAMQTRTGKTITCFETIRKAGLKNVLFVTKKKAIISVQKDYQHFKQYFDCTVINYESVGKCEGGYDIVVLDESHCCFLGNTLVDGKKIMDIKVGDSLSSFNFSKKITEKRIVIKIHKNELSENIVSV